MRKRALRIGGTGLVETAKDLQKILKNLSFCGFLSWSSILLGYEISLLGFIEDSANSIAVVGGPEDEWGDRKTATLRIGQSFNHYRLLNVCNHGANFVDDNGYFFFLKPGGFNFHTPDVVEGVSNYEDRTEISQETYDYIRGDGLLQVMYDAASEPYYENGDIVGFTLFDIEPFSIFETAGIENYDTITEIDGVKLDSPIAAIRVLQYLRTLDQPSFYITYLREGRECSRRVIVK